MSEETKNKLRKYKGPLSSQYGKKHSPERIKSSKEKLHVEYGAIFLIKKKKID